MKTKINNFQLVANPTIRTWAEGITESDFFYYDKDGFELCEAERKLYQYNRVEMNSYLNHYCCQQHWLDVEGVIVDHALILHRYDYSEDARAQLSALKHRVPQAGWLLQTRQKWGFDLAIDSVTDYGHMFEVVHIEQDSYDFVNFKEDIAKIEQTIERIDWIEAARQIWHHRDKWMYLKGFYQNHWKADYLFGWKKAEYTEKSI